MLHSSLDDLVVLFLLSSWLCLPYRDINYYYGDHLGALLSLFDRLLDADNLAILKGDQGLHLGILSLGLVDLKFSNVDG